MPEEQAGWEINPNINFNCPFLDEEIYCCHPRYMNSPNPDALCRIEICPIKVIKKEKELDYPMDPDLTISCEPDYDHNDGPQ